MMRDFSEQRQVLDAEAPVSFGVAFAGSATFDALYREGMALVEETSTYLDSEGRVEAKRLSRASSVVYATESMRLTTRLMQLASWLLLHRSVAEGSMTERQVATERRKVKIEGLSGSAGGTSWDELPDAFRALVERSLSLLTRIQRIDASISAGASPQPAANPIASHLKKLDEAFATR